MGRQTGTDPKSNRGGGTAAVLRPAPAQEAVGPQLDRVAQQWAAGVDHGARWPMTKVAAKYHAVEAAQRVVDQALTASGGTGMLKTSELERLYLDVRCGGFHPANSALVHELVGKTMLGVLGEEPRW